MSRQKATKRRRRRRRGGLGFVYMLLCLALITGAIASALAVFFKADHITVEGNNRYDAQQVIDVSEVQYADNLFFMNKYDVAAKITKALPYVEAVRINRQLPDTLCIHIEECVCSVAIRQEGTAWILCSTGKIVDSVAAEESEGYTVVTGLALREPTRGAVVQADETDEMIRQQLLTILQQLRAKGMLSQVQEIHLEDPELITIRYLDRFNAEFLWGADFDYKLDFLAAVAAKLENNERGTLKLTKDGEARFIME